MNSTKWVYCNSVKETRVHFEETVENGAKLLADLHEQNRKENGAGETYETKITY